MALINLLKSGYHSLLIAVCFGIVSALLLSSCAVAQNSSDGADGACHIRGKVLDSYGTCVPGSEVRLLMPDGMLCAVPDNPTLSGARLPVDEGSFEFRGVPPDTYLLTAVKGDSLGSISISIHGGDNYAEITLTGYVYRRPVSDSDGSSGSLITAVPPVLTGPEFTRYDASGVDTAEIKPDLLQVFVCGLIILAGVSFATLIFKKR